jgi:hypothetical protein
MFANLCLNRLDCMQGSWTCTSDCEPCLFDNARLSFNCVALASTPSQCRDHQGKTYRVKGQSSTDLRKAAQLLLTLKIINTEEDCEKGEKGSNSGGNSGGDNSGHQRGSKSEGSKPTGGSYPPGGGSELPGGGSQLPDSGSSGLSSLLGSFGSGSDSVRPLLDECVGIQLNSCFSLEAQ